MNENNTQNGTKRLSVLLGCYGDFPHYSLRAIEGIVNEAGVGGRCDFHVGCNECCAATVNRLRYLADEGRIQTLIESRPNLNKDPMMRLLLAVTTTPFVLWLDDDSWLQPGWLDAFERLFDEEPPFDTAGAVYTAPRWPEYDAFVRRRPWWRDEALTPDDQQDKVVFPVGGMFLARTDWMRSNNFPDRGMIKLFDDVLMGDLINQTGARFIPFSYDVWQHIAISDGQRRGSGEDADGWRDSENATVPM